MQRQAVDRSPRASILRVLLIDDHEISRAACRALLRTEGVEVVADHGLGEDALALVAELSPEVVILDVAPHDDRALGLARRLRALDEAPTVLLTSSADRAAFGTRLDGFKFLAKADLCRGAVLTAIPPHPSKETR